MIIETGRFGQITVSENELISIPQGILGFPEDTSYCLVDPGDDTLILWLQSTKNPNLAFPVLEPKIFKGDYIVRLSAAELRELQLASIKRASVFTILTIPQNMIEMSANLKAPLVINTDLRVAKQVVLQENDQPIQHLMFKELRAHLLHMHSAGSKKEAKPSKSVVAVQSLPTSIAVQAI